MADKRILTTHAGSLPRPARLVELYAARPKGEKIDEAELVRKGEAATRWIVEKQREAGIDIPSDGEQLRKTFFALRLAAHDWVLGEMETPPWRRTERLSRVSRTTAPANRGGYRSQQFHPADGDGSGYLRGYRRERSGTFDLRRRLECGGWQIYGCVHDGPVARHRRGRHEERALSG